MNGPRCGSPVMIRGARWECGWCLDSGWLSAGAQGLQIPLRFVCRVDLPEAWDSLRAALAALVPAHAEALLPALGRAAAHQLSLSPAPEDGRIEGLILRDLRGFLETEKPPGIPAQLRPRLERGEILFAGEGGLSASSFGSFWQSLLDALEQEDKGPQETDTDEFFGTLALFRSWRRGGPGNDPDYLGAVHALQDAFHARWETRRTEEGSR